MLLLSFKRVTTLFDAAMPTDVYVLSDESM